MRKEARPSAAMSELALGANTDWALQALQVSNSRFNERFYSILSDQTLSARRTVIKKGDSVVIFGAGPVGLFAAKSAWFMGADGVLLVAKIGDAMNRGITIRNSETSVKRNIGRCFHHIQAGQINPKDIIIYPIPLEKIAEGYRMFAARLDGIIKRMVIPPRANY